VLGESRYDEEFTDRRIIEARICGEFDGGQLRTFVNFERSVLGQEWSEAEARNFWLRTAFYNYNVNFFPGRARVRLNYQKREDPQNVVTLRRVVTDLKPSHCIVWGLGNWESIDAASEWKDGWIPESTEPYCATTIDGHTTLFTRVRHPSCGLSSDYWYPVLSRFLTLRPQSD